eukprot:1159118-Pelagomonas_calceolata.AAC.3
MQDSNVSLKRGTGLRGMFPKQMGRHTFFGCAACEHKEGAKQANPEQAKQQAKPRVAAKQASKAQGRSRQNPRPCVGKHTMQDTAQASLNTGCPTRIHFPSRVFANTAKQYTEGWPVLSVCHTFHRFKGNPCKAAQHTHLYPPPQVLSKPVKQAVWTQVVDVMVVAAFVE